MRRLFELLLCCTMGAALSASPAFAQHATSRPAIRAFPADSEVLEIIRQRVTEKRSAGIVVGMLEPDGRVHVVAYGDPGPGQPPLDGNSVFEIGSVTKVFTGTVLADMVTKGEVKLDDPVQKYLPAAAKMPTRSGKQITLANLSEQNSGLPRLPGNMRPANALNPYADYTVQQLYEFLSSYELPRDPGAQYEYSNLAVGLLGHVLALRAGQSYEEMVRARIFAPLGMTHSAIALTPWMQAHLAAGHNPAGAVVSNWDLPTLAGAGAIRSTVLDMLKFLRAYVNPTDKRLGVAVALAQRERAATTIPNMGIALNWHVLHAAADTIVWHNGGTGGYRSFAGFLPRKRTAVVVLTNSGGQGADDLGFHLLSPQIPLAAGARP